jgi:hypothetical protein
MSKGLDSARIVAVWTWVFFAAVNIGAYEINQDEIVFDGDSRVVRR